MDTRFTGSPVFIQNFQEFGVFLAPGRESRFGLGIQLMTGDHGLFGLSVSTGVRFQRQRRRALPSALLRPTS
ncbi:MAG: hypothetical protein WCP77_13055 [Roseococcus sp.]